MTNSKDQRGGARPGAGRKAAFGEPTTTLRVPISAKPSISAYLDALKTPAANQEPPLPADAWLPALEAPKLELPVGLSKVSAGFPSPAEDFKDRELDINEFTNLLPLEVDLLYRLGLCSIAQFGCTPPNVFGPLTFFNPNGTFPKLPANLPVTTALLVDDTLGDVYGPFYTPAFDILFPLEQALSASGSGVAGPFVIDRV